MYRTIYFTLFLPLFSLAQFQYNHEDDALVYLDKVDTIFNIDSIESKGCEIIAQTSQGHIICDCYVKFGILHDSKNENYSDVKFNLSIKKKDEGYEMLYHDIYVVSDSIELPIQSYLYEESGDEKQGDEAQFVNASFHFLNNNFKKLLSKVD